VGRLDGKVAFITGAARGQGRAHCLRLAQEGADIIAVDICADIASVPYALGSRADLEETVKLVESNDRRIVSDTADVRSRAQLAAAVEHGLAEFGHIDIVIANAGILAVPGEGQDDEQAWHDSIAVMLTGVWHTLKVTTPSMIERGTGGSIILTSSTAGLRGVTDGSGGLDGYGAAKHGVVGLMRGYANVLARHSIRVNTIHPNAVATPMIMNEPVMAWAQTTGYPPSALPIDLMEPSDVSNAVAWLASDEARYVTGVELSVDAGFFVNTTNMQTGGSPVQAASDAAPA
jgi:SDR family mycofactocin-dependent oxidoreductase